MGEMEGKLKHVHKQKKLGNRESNRRFFSLSKQKKTNRGKDKTKVKG